MIGGYDASIMAGAVVSPAINWSLKGIFLVLKLEKKKNESFRF